MNVSDRTSDRGTGEAIRGSWRLDPQRSRVEFRVRHFWGLVTIKGHFDTYDGQLDMSANPAVKLTIDAASLQTRNRKRDRHLRSDDFFDSANHPNVQFISDAVELRGNTLKVSGRLSAAGRSIPIELDAIVRHVDGEIEIEATAAAPHRDLGMTYSPLGMIASRSRLLVKGRLLPQSERPA